MSEQEQSYKITIHMAFAFEVNCANEGFASQRAQIEAAVIANFVREGYPKDYLAEMRRERIEIEQAR